MNYRALGRTGWKISEISFGAWAIGGSWGQVSDGDSMAALHQAIDCGVNFIDTADVYGNGRSERLIARLKKERKDAEIIVATKAGRRLPQQTVEGYSRQNLTGWIDDSLRNLSRDTLDLMQLHCPPTALYDRPEVFRILDDLVKAGKIRYYGVSVQTVEEALKAIEFPNVQSVQIIFNCFRQRPAEIFFAQAKLKKVGILARVPLASGLLTGKLWRDSTFAADDHRNFNRKGQAFDVGETFSGVDYEQGLAAVEEIRKLVPSGSSMSQFALRWILMFDALTCAIPGGKRGDQVADNCGASDLPALTAEQMAGVKRIYDERIRPLVQDRW
jgi:aryl-alcohol dehydrogenase-like predicted oxidoreductase